MMNQTIAVVFALTDLTLYDLEDVFTKIRPQSKYFFIQWQFINSKGELSKEPLELLCQDLKTQKKIDDFFCFNPTIGLTEAQNNRNGRLFAFHMCKQILQTDKIDFQYLGIGVESDEEEKNTFRPHHDPLPQLNTIPIQTQSNPSALKQNTQVKPKPKPKPKLNPRQKQIQQRKKQQQIALMRRRVIQLRKQRERQHRSGHNKGHF